MRKRQSGITFIGLLLILIPVAIVGYGAIRLTPIYINYFRVVKALEQIVKEGSDGGNSATSSDSLRNSLSRRFDVEYVEHPTVKEIQIERADGAWKLTADYEDIAPLVGNVSLLVQFHKEVTVQ